MTKAHPSESRGRKASGLTPSGHDSGVADGGPFPRPPATPRAPEVHDPAAHSNLFVHRAARLVAFVIGRGSDASSAARREFQLMAWITAHQRSSKCVGAQQHFAATELGIILRALNGPAADLTQLERVGLAPLSMVIARCMVQQS